MTNYAIQIIHQILYLLDKSSKARRTIAFLFKTLNRETLTKEQQWEPV